MKLSSKRSCLKVSVFSIFSIFQKYVSVADVQIKKVLQHEEEFFERQSLLFLGISGIGREWYPSIGREKDSYRPIPIFSIPPAPALFIIIYEEFGSGDQNLISEMEMTISWHLVVNLQLNLIVNFCWIYLNFERAFFSSKACHEISPFVDGCQSMPIYWFTFTIFRGWGRGSHFFLFLQKKKKNQKNSTFIFSLFCCILK